MPTLVFFIYFRCCTPSEPTSSIKSCYTTFSISISTPSSKQNRRPKCTVPWHTLSRAHHWHPFRIEMKRVSKFLCGRHSSYFRNLPYLMEIICQRLDLICINIYEAFQRHLLIACYVRRICQ